MRQELDPGGSSQHWTDLPTNSFALTKRLRAKSSSFMGRSLEHSSLVTPKTSNCIKPKKCDRNCKHIANTHYLVKDLQNMRPAISVLNFYSNNMKEHPLFKNFSFGWLCTGDTSDFTTEMFWHQIKC